MLFSGGKNNLHVYSFIHFTETQLDLLDKGVSYFFSLAYH